MSGRWRWGCRLSGGRLPGLGACGFAAAGLTQLKIAPQQAILLGLWSPLDQGPGPADVAAGRRFLSLEPVQQKALIQGLGLVGEGRNHPVAALDCLVELIEPNVRQAVIETETPLGDGLLCAAAQQCQAS